MHLVKNSHEQNVHKYINFLSVYNLWSLNIYLWMNFIAWRKESTK